LYFLLFIHRILYCLVVCAIRRAKLQKIFDICNSYDKLSMFFRQIIIFFRQIINFHSEDCGRFIPKIVEFFVRKLQMLAE